MLIDTNQTNPEQVDKMNIVAIREIAAAIILSIAAIGISSLARVYEDDHSIKGTQMHVTVNRILGNNLHADYYETKLIALETLNQH